MEFKEIVKERYAAKKFDGQILAQEKVDGLFEMIRLAASSFGLQPWKIKVVTDQKLKDALQAASWDQPQVGTCSHLLVFCADTQIDALIDRLAQEMSKTGMPAESLDSYVKLMRGFAEGLQGEQRLSWAQRQVYIALGNALNGAKALGFDSCPMEGFDPKEYARMLELPANLVPTVVCPVGYATDKQKQKVRFPKEDVFF
ncbi:NAD(P)H-dependent oxidoreductase [Candidatus Micrarchaeota archaeon]|nr:NAD(P)H-dependent oxidoreductase [Candidatus Micrarchaeota archaeon]